MQLHHGKRIVIRLVLLLSVAWFASWGLHSQILSLNPFARSHVLCVMQAQAASGSQTQSFVTTQALDRFYFTIKADVSGQPPQLTFSQGTKVYYSGHSLRFSCGANLQPDTYTLRIEQGSQPIPLTVTVSSTKVAITTWQAFVVALLLATAGTGFWARRARAHGNARQHAVSSNAFKRLSLAVFILFSYLLMHEGGHALASIAFRDYDFSQSDFFGLLGGSPHSGLKAGMQVERWQRAIESISGPLMPVIVGWVLFLVWRSLWGRRLRERLATVDLFFTSLVAMPLLTFIVFAGYLMGIISDGDWQGFIQNMPYPLWLVRSIMTGMLLITAFMLWCLAPSLLQAFRDLKGTINQAPSVPLDDIERSKEDRASPSY